MKLLHLRLLAIPVFFVFGFVYSGLQAQQSLSGNYTVSTGEVTLNLKLTQQGNALQGSLSGTTGASFILSGQVENGIGYGTCAGAEGSVFFEAYGDGDDLTLSLVEPDAYGAPDYNQARYLQFIRQNTGQAGATGNATSAVTGALGLGANETQGQAQSSPDTKAGSTGYASGTGTATAGRGSMDTGTTGSGSIGAGGASGITGTTAAASVGENEVGDPAWGIKFGLPQGWIRQQNMQGAVVGHNTIAGMLLVSPHMSANMQEMQAEMMQGIQEEGNYLTPSGGLQQLSQNVLAGDYTGVADGTQVKARGFGILSPNGGGAYLIAVSTPDKLGPELIGAAESMVNSVQYFKVDVDDLMQHFAGNWAHFTSNTSTWICFCPDGTYKEDYESSYSGDFNDGAGNWTGGWGATGQDSNLGRWTVRGNKDSGTIIVKLSNRNEIYYEYQVHIERGEKYYREYRFNGDLYSKKQ